MKKLSLVLFSLLMSLSLFAKDYNFDDVCKKLSENPNMIGEFTQEKLLQNAKRPIKSSGNFIICTDGLMWNTLKPFPSKMIVTETFIDQTNSKGISTTTDISQNPVFSNVWTMINSIFNGNSEEIYKSFDVNFSKFEQSWSVVLTPKSEQIASVLKELKLSGLYSEKCEIQKMIMTESLESATTYNFFNTKFPKELSQDEKTLFIKK